MAIFMLSLFGVRWISPHITARHSPLSVIPPCLQRESGGFDEKPLVTMETATDKVAVYTALFKRSVPRA
jgi:hypothetical protein